MFILPDIHMLWEHRLSFMDRNDGLLLAKLDTLLIARMMYENNALS